MPEGDESQSDRDDEHTHSQLQRSQASLWMRLRVKLEVKEAWKHEGHGSRSGGSHNLDSENGGKEARG